MLPPVVKNRFDISVEEVATVYADERAWSEVISLIPDFVARAHELFGRHLPHINFNLFAKYSDLAEHFREITGHPKPLLGTGGIGWMIACKTDRNKRPAHSGSPGVVMHEYGHALCNTIYGSQYLNHIPSWLNEGFADYAALPWAESWYESAPVIIRNAAQNGTLPTFRTLSRNFFKYDEAAYPIARLMVVELLRGRGPEAVGEILQQAKDHGGAFVDVVTEMANRRPQDLYAKVITDCGVDLDAAEQARIAKKKPLRTPWMRYPETEKRWRKHVSEWESSGKSARDYAAEAGVNASRLYAWRKEIALRDKEKQQISPDHKDYVFYI